MRLPIGSEDVSTSGGNATLIGRRGEGWLPVSTTPSTLDEAIALLSSDGHDGGPLESSVDDAASVGDARPFFAAGEVILWRYRRVIETARVIRDDERGLVVWIPSGSARLDSVPADGRSSRDVPLEERFTVPWVIRESTWRGEGIVRVAPTGMPWSIWFFRDADGTPSGAYVNLELPHRRAAGEPPSIFTRDLVLDVWVDAGHPGSEDIWLKDADELDAAVVQGRFTAAQAEAIRALADNACRLFIADGSWPLDEGWESWIPDAAMDQPIELPDVPAIRDARQRTGRTSIHG